MFIYTHTLRPYPLQAPHWFVLNRCRGTPADTPTGPSRHRLFPLGEYPTTHTQGTPVRRSGRRSGGFHYGGLLAQVWWRTLCKTVPARSQEERDDRGQQGRGPAPPEPPARTSEARHLRGAQVTRAPPWHPISSRRYNTSTDGYPVPWTSCGPPRLVSLANHIAY